jgi:hypothetical protein
MTARRGSSPPEVGRVTLQNRLSPKQPQRLALETAVRGALEGLEGNWDVVLEAPDGLPLVVAVIAPDGSSWTMSCCSPAQRDPESIAASVRAACNRRRWLKPGGAAGANPQGGTEPSRKPATEPGGKRA